VSFHASGNGYTALVGLAYLHPGMLRKEFRMRFLRFRSELCKVCLHEQ
jgi:hypothetical protein